MPVEHATLVAVQPNTVSKQGEGEATGGTQQNRPSMLAGVAITPARKKVAVPLVFHFALIFRNVSGCTGPHP